MTLKLDLASLDAEQKIYLTQLRINEASRCPARGADPWQRWFDLAKTIPPTNEVADYRELLDELYDRS